MKTKIKTFPLAYQLWKETSHGYNHLNISILAAKRWNKEDMETLFSLRWQSDKESGFSRWYGLSLQASFNGWNSISESLSQTARLYKALAEITKTDDSPRSFLKALDGKKIPRVVYDARLSRYVNQDQMPDARLHRWRDEAEQNCTVTALAGNEADAQNEIARAFGDLIAGAPSYAESLSKWIQKGKPVSIAYGSKAPEWESLADLLNESAEEPALAAA